MRYTNGGYIGSGNNPKASGNVDGIWRYYTDISSAIKQNSWYVASMPTNVVVSPSIVTQGTGVSVTLTASYDNDPQGYIETFQWQTSLNNIDWTDIENQINNTLVFNMSESDDGTYRRYKINRGFKSTFSDSSSLSVVYYTITISSHPSNLSIYAGSSGTFTVTASVDEETSLNYQWQLSSNAGSSWSSAPGTSTNASYTTPAVLFSSSGNLYRCYLTADGAEPIASNSATLIVHNNIITITSQPSNAYCYMINPATFTVSATITNNASLSYAWYKSTTQNGTYTLITEADAGFSGYNTSVLTIDCDDQTSNLYVKCKVYWSIIEQYSNSALYDVESGGY